MKKNTGITLIALIVTIIILLILAGITINFMLGDNGILNRAKNAGETYEEQAAREKLEIALVDLTADKMTDSAYNENAYIDEKLTKQNMIVNGDIVIVDGWQFEIDRRVPQIGASIGKGQQNEQIQIVVTSQTSSDYTKAMIQIKITYTGNITSITIKGENVGVPTPENNVYTVNKEVTVNGNYTILVKDEEGNYRTASITISDITEDIEIWNKEDMEVFRDKVNSGRTFEGRTVQVMADINLEGAQNNQWIPIGNSTTVFNGNFDGNFHTIHNLYINSNSYESVGLFGNSDSESVIQNIIIENANISNTNDIESSTASYTGTIVGYTSGKVINCGVESGNIHVKKTKNASNTEVGGIIGRGIYCKVSNCYNKATITAETTIMPYASSIVGGIVGFGHPTISNCYNTGNISSTGYYSFGGGIIGQVFQISIENGTNDLINCYNTGKINTTQTNNYGVAGIVGRNGWDNDDKPINIINSYCTTATTYSQYYFDGSNMVTSVTGRISEETLQGYTNILGEAYLQDSQNINNGYPILKWQLEQK